MRAIGFHGTSAEAARRILASGFEISRNEYDWLGDGAYFFQDAPARAMEWARERFGENAAVLGAEIDLDGCIDLFDIPWERTLARTFELYREELAARGEPVPKQTRGAHRLDRHVINYLAGRIAVEGRNVRSVRAVFAEGIPVFPGSALLNRSHVQISVAMYLSSEGSGAMTRSLEMLDPDETLRWVEHHFATVTPEEFVTNVKRYNPDLAQEMWGNRSVAEICRERRHPVRRARRMFASVGRSVLRLFS